MITKRHRLLQFLPLFLTLFFTQSLLSEKVPIAEYRKLLEESGEKQILAIRGLKETGYHTLLPEISDLLKSNKTSEPIIIEVLNLYESYNVELEHYLPNYNEDYEWVMANSQSDKMLLHLVHSMLARRDKRFIFAVSELITHRNSDIREAAFKYLNSFQDDRVLPFILELGNSDKPIYRYYYLEALRFTNDERATVHLPKLLLDPSPALRMEAIAVVGKMNIKEKHQQVLSMARNDSNYEVRKSATLFAKSQNQKYRTDIFQGGLNDSHPEVREASIDSITSFKDASYANSVSNSLEKESLSPLRLKLMDALVAMKSPGSGNGLSAALKNDKQEDVRKMAAIVAGKLHAKQVLPALLVSLPLENSIIVKKEIAKTLGILKEKSAIPAILTALKKTNEDKSIKTEMLLSLDLINDPRVMPIIFDILNEEPTDFRENIKDFLRTMLYRHHGDNKLVKS